MGQSVNEPTTGWFLSLIHAQQWEKPEGFRPEHFTHFIRHLIQHVIKAESVSDNQAHIKTKLGPTRQTIPPYSYYYTESVLDMY